MKADLFNTNTNAGCLRIEGVIISLIEWWVQVGGLENLKAVADACNFEAIEVKRDDKIGEIVNKHHNFMQDFVNSLKRNPGLWSQLMMIYRTGVKSNYYDVGIVGQMLTHRFNLEVGHQLVKSGWWKENQSKIKKQREQFKMVRKIMES